VGAGYPFPLFTSSFVLSLFPLSFSHLLYIFCSFVHLFPFYQNRPTGFQAIGHRRRPNVGLVCSVYFVLSVLLSSDLFWCFVVFGLV